MANTGSTLLALITGAAIGAAAGLLYAPDSGEKTRKKLSDDARKAQDQFNKKYQETSSNLNTKAKKARMDFETRLEETLSSASYKADEILAAMETKLEELRRQNAKLQRDAKADSGETTREQTGGKTGNQTTGKAVI